MGQPVIPTSYIRLLCFSQILFMTKWIKQDFSWNCVTYLLSWPQAVILSHHLFRFGGVRSQAHCQGAMRAGSWDAGARSDVTWLAGERPLQPGPRLGWGEQHRPWGSSPVGSRDHITRQFHSDEAGVKVNPASQFMVQSPSPDQYSQARYGCDAAAV